MIKVQVGEAVKDYDDVTECWIIQQINDRRHSGQSVCVRVTIKKDSLNMILSTSGCPIAPSKPRQPNPSEAEIFGLWDHLGLNDEKFSPGNVVAFLKQLRRWIGK